MTDQPSAEARDELIDRIVGGLFDAYKLSPNDIDEKREAMVRVIQSELAPLLSEIARLEKLVYVPGVWKCAKCGCGLISTTLHVDVGAFSANNLPQQCPNGCGPMWRRTERDAGNELIDQMDSVRDAALEQAAKVADRYATEAAESAQITAMRAAQEARETDVYETRQAIQQHFKNDQHYFHGKRHCAVEIAKATRELATGGSRG